MESNRAFTLIELLVVVAIIAIVAAILFPVFNQARQAKKLTTELISAKRIGLASQLYTLDHDDRYPGACFSDAYLGNYPIVPGEGSDVDNQWLLTDRLWPYLKDEVVQNEYTRVRARKQNQPKRANSDAYYRSSGGWNYLCVRDRTDGSPRTPTRTNNPLTLLARLENPNGWLSGKTPEPYACERKMFELSNLSEIPIIMMDGVVFDSDAKDWESKFYPKARGGQGLKGRIILVWADYSAKSVMADYDRFLKLLLVK